MNLDPQEISKFEELASRWWDPGSEFTLLSFRRCRVPKLPRFPLSRRKSPGPSIERRSGIGTSRRSIETPFLI